MWANWHLLGRRNHCRPRRVCRASRPLEPVSCRVGGLLRIIRRRSDVVFSRPPPPHPKVHREDIGAPHFSTRIASFGEVSEPFHFIVSIHLRYSQHQPGRHRPERRVGATLFRSQRHCRHGLGRNVHSPRLHICQYGRRPSWRNKKNRTPDYDCRHHCCLDFWYSPIGTTEVL